MDFSCCLQRIIGARVGIKGDKDFLNNPGAYKKHSLPFQSQTPLTVNYTYHEEWKLYMLLFPRFNLSLIILACLPHPGNNRYNWTKQDLVYSFPDNPSGQTRLTTHFPINYPNIKSRLWPPTIRLTSWPSWTCTNPSTRFGTEQNFSHFTVFHHKVNNKLWTTQVKLKDNLSHSLQLMYSVS